MNISTIYQAFRGELLSLTAVTNIIGQRAFYGVVPKDEMVPAITLSPQGGDAPVYYQGSSGLATVTVQVSVFSRSAGEVLSLVDSIMGHFNGYSGNLNGDADAYVAPSSVEASQSLPEEDGIHGAVFDVNLTYAGV